MTPRMDNVEILRRAAAAAVVRTGAARNAFLEILDPAVEWEVNNSFGDLRGHFRGVDEVRRWFGRWAEAWGVWEWTYEELRPVGDHVVAHIHHRMRGRSTGIEAETHQGQIWTFRNGLVVRFQDFDSWEEALAAAGADP